MPITPGFRLGPYIIETALGAGGMGEVFKARDTRLDRSVAIKFLSEEIGNPTARTRFQQEAKTASALNHPHIVTVHEAGELDERLYLVTEYVDGGTLQDWARSEKRSWRQVVDVMIGVADALSTAHTAGILHRDIKPGNILMTGGGYAKLADFGLARLDEHSPPEGITRTEMPLTRPGVVMGTVPYMSPEQVLGKSLDTRSDIFSFGIVLHELLSGQRPFGGSSDMEVLQTILHGAPDTLPQTVPLALRAIVDKALEKEPADRYQSMRELVVDLRRTARQKSGAIDVAASPAAAISRRSRSSLWLWAAAAAALLAVIGWFAVSQDWLRREPPAAQNPLESARFTRITDSEGEDAEAAISPDGRFVAFVSDRNGRFDIWMTQVGTGSFVNLTRGHEHATDFRTQVQSIGFFPDGSTLWLGGGPDRRVHQLPLTGGALRPFLGGKVVSPAWSPDGTGMVFQVLDDGDPMFVADRTGSSPRRIYVDKAGVHAHFPVWSTDGQWIYFARGIWATFEMDLWRVPVSGGAPERMTRHGSEVEYPTPIDDHTILYVAPAADGSGPWLWALNTDQKTSRRVSFGLERYTSISASADGRRLVATVTNPTANLWSVPILEGIASEKDVIAFPLPTVRALAPRFAGASVFYLSSRGGGDGLWRHRDGEALEIWKGAEIGLREAPSPSPDGSRVAIVLRREGKLRLHVVSADGAELQSLADGIDVRGAAAWSPDGRSIVTGGIDASGPGLFKIAVSGGAPVRMVQGFAFNPVWSPDGSVILYAGPNVNANSPLLAVTPDGSPVELPAIQVPFANERFRFVPDGSGVVYMQGLFRQEFWLLDLRTKATRQLTRLSNTAQVRSFDITPDSKRIVFDRSRENADVVLIER